MKKFHEKHKEEVSVTFLVIGTKNGDNCDRRSVLCCQTMLEETRKSFDKVHSISIYSLHQGPTTIQSLLNTDFCGKYKEPIEAYPRRLRIVSLIALDAQKTRRNQKPIFSTFEIPEFLPESKRESLTKKSILIKSDQHKIKDAFAITVHNNREMEVSFVFTTSISV